MKGRFEVIDSFAIRRRNEFYLIGNLIEGTVKEYWFINVPLSGSLSITVRIKAIEDIELSGESKIYKLLITEGDNETTDMMLALKIGSEYLDITTDGED